MGAPSRRRSEGTEDSLPSTFVLKKAPSNDDDEYEKLKENIHCALSDNDENMSKRRKSSLGFPDHSLKRAI